MEKNYYRRAFKLTESHINPTNYERINVRKAAQLLSDSGVRAIRHYRAQRKFAFPLKGSESTEKNTKLMNDVFDIINGRCVKQGINISNWLKKEEKLYRHLSTNFGYYRGVSPVKKTSWFQYSSQYVCIEDYLENLANFRAECHCF